MSLDRSSQRSPLQKRLYFASKSIYKLTGRLPAPWATGHSVDGKPVLVIHTPKSAGSTLKALLGSKPGKTSHSMPARVMRHDRWLNSFIVTSVRHPFDRFVSSYSFVVKSRGSGTLQRIYGDALSSLDPFEFIEFIQQYPEKLGQQTQWTHYPSRSKPLADLILKVEDSDNWPAQLITAGISKIVPQLRPRNASRDPAAQVQDILGVSAAQVLDLQRTVRQLFASDYDAFGYDD